ncbi:MAG: tetratricopeptide repeat protein, partial [Candidatus Krumholzibacteria bacterium]|nr:tetratricopeptide repeat protein [Candidatus Krumholzibacteria bacterium]
LITTDSEFEELVHEGIESFNTGAFDTAIEAFEKAASIHDNYADIRFKLGLSYLRKGACEPARREFEKAIEINPQYTEARFYLGVSYLDEKLFSRALPCFERAVEEKPDYADLRCYLGTTCFFLGELDSAKRHFERALELSPHYKKACHYYGLLLYTLGEKESATEMLGKAIDGWEKRDPAGMSLALVHLREGNLEEAMAVLHEILNAGHRSPDVLYFIGDIYLRMERYGEAERFFTESIEANPDFLRAKTKLAHILMKTDMIAEAEKLLDTLDKDFADLYKIKGDLAFLKGDNDRAEQLYKKSLEINSGYEEASLSLSMTLRKRGLEKEAERVLMNLLEQDPENVLARNLLGHGTLDLEPS